MTKEETLNEQKTALSKDLEALLKREQDLRMDLEQTIANINATKGALQYHDILTRKLSDVEQAQIASEKPISAEVIN